MLTRREYCYMYLMWLLAICVMIWYIHSLLTLPNKDSFYLRGEKGPDL